MSGYLIKDTTKEEREAIVAESLGNISATCDGCSADSKPYIPHQICSGKAKRSHKKHTCGAGTHAGSVQTYDGNTRIVCRMIH